MKLLKILLAMTVMAGGGFAYAESKAVGQSSYATINQDQAADLAGDLGFLVDDAKVTGIESVTEPFDSWKVSFASPHWSPSDHYEGYVELKKSDGSMVAVVVKENSGSRIPEQIFDILEQKVNLEEAISLVEAFMAEQSWFAKLPLIYRPYQPTPRETNYSDRSLHTIRFDQSLNGIRLSHGNPVFAAYVDRRTGEIAGYEANWFLPSVIPEPVEVVPLAEIANKVFDDVSPELVYPYPQDPENHPPLVWELNLRDRSLNALTGKWVGDHPSANRLRHVGPPPEKAILMNSGISEEEYLKVPWPAIDEQAARQNALYYLQQKLPGSLDQLMETPYSSLSFWTYPKVYSFSFVRVADGIRKASGDSVEVQVDAVTGELRNPYNIHLDLTGTEYPAAAKPVVLPERAKRLLLSLYDIELEYYDTGVDGLQLFYTIKVKPDTPVFFTGAPPYVDALQPEQWWDYLSYPVTEPIPTASDWLKEIISSPERITYTAAVALNGKHLPLLQEPVIHQDTTLVPFRGLLENMGAAVHWDNEKRKVTASSDSTMVELTIDSHTALVNGKPYTLSVPAQIIDHSTYIPVRFLAEVLGAKVHWEVPSRLVHIVTDQSFAADLADTELKQLRFEAQQSWEEKHWQ